mmetsp:Transcript_26764/g.63684  ORF Transcript_26764/g.63684 Transcript_26764/m.63684 type:complete len:212 (+) Transcript_26764:114-749(+)
MVRAWMHAADGTVGVVGATLVVHTRVEVNEGDCLGCHDLGCDVVEFVDNGIAVGPVGAVRGRERVLQLGTGLEQRVGDLLKLRRVDSLGLSGVVQIMKAKVELDGIPLHRLLKRGLQIERKALKAIGRGTRAAVGHIPRAVLNLTSVLELRCNDTGVADADTVTNDKAVGKSGGSWKRRSDSATAVGSRRRTSSLVRWGVLVHAAGPASWA